MPKSYNYQLTMPNWTEESRAELISKTYEYLIVAKEIAPTTGLPHLQCFIRFKNQRHMKSVIQEFPGCHVTLHDHKSDKGIEYCAAEGPKYTGKPGWVSCEEFGVRPSTPQEKGAQIADKWSQARSLAKQGKFEEIDSELYVKYLGSFKRIRADAELDTPIEDTEDKHLWYYGPTGTGKSRTARENHPELYLKMCNRWWDGYTNQETVLIEDIDKNHDGLLHHMKIWADRYPFPGEKKGSCCKIRPKLIIVTSNYHPSDIWPDQTTVLPILRRFNVIYFPDVPQVLSPKPWEFIGEGHKRIKMFA